MNKLLNKIWFKGKAHLKQMLVESRRVTICLDGWTKKGLTSSFLGISACFYDPKANTARHVILDLTQLHHPHTGEQLAAELSSCLKDWSIDKDKVILIVTDNGANIVKAIRILRENQFENEPSTAADGDCIEDVEMNDEDENDDVPIDNDEQNGSDLNDFQLPLNVRYRRMQCMAHTLQLIIKRVYKHYVPVLEKVKHLVFKIRKSSIAVQMLLAKCGKTVIADNITRWNSTYQMAKRLIEIKSFVNEVLNSILVDSLRIEEWARLEEMTNLLEPFAVQTDLLQTDSTSISSIIPALLDLECHLEQFPHAKTLTRSLLTDIHERFATILNPSYPDFNPLPAAACLLDPNYGALLFTPDGRILLEPTKTFIVHEV